MNCKYNKDEFCTNDQCPMRGDYCPVPNDDGVCKYEYRVEEAYMLSPRGCLEAAFLYAKLNVDEETFSTIWNTFAELMRKNDYVKEE